MTRVHNRPIDDMGCNFQARSTLTEAHTHITIETGATVTSHTLVGHRSPETDFLRLDTTTTTTVETVATVNEIAIFIDPEVTRIELADERRCRAKVEDRRCCRLQEIRHRSGQQGAAVDRPTKGHSQTPTAPNSHPFRCALLTTAQPKVRPSMNRETETRQFSQRCRDLSVLPCLVHHRRLKTLRAAARARHRNNSNVVEASTIVAVTSLPLRR